MFYLKLILDLSNINIGQICYKSVILLYKYLNLNEIARFPYEMCICLLYNW